MGRTGRGTTRGLPVRRGLRAGPQRWRLLAAAAAGVAVLVTAGCTGGGAPTWQGGGEPSAAPPQPAGPQIVATITEPAPNATNVVASTEVVFTTENAEDAAVEVIDDAGRSVPGELQPDGRTWLPERQLGWGRTYTATVTATGADGRTGQATSTFTVMDKPTKLVRVSSFLGDGQVVGVGMPMIVRFGRAIPEQHRAAVERRMTLKSTPKQEGSWRWTSATEVHYRPKNFWKPDTRIFYKLQTGGLPMGDGWYGRTDLTVDLKIGPALVMTVDNKTKKMTVTRDGKVIKTIPVSLGKKRTPSSSGTMLVMEKHRKTVFDTTDQPGPASDRYRIDIEYAQRLTYGGEFVHAAGWSVDAQGRRNVSHGCVNMSPANAKWLFDQTRMGDPVIVKGTERKIQPGNGWTDWNLSWDEYVKGSALSAGD